MDPAIISEPLKTVEAIYYTFTYGPTETIAYEVVPEYGDSVEVYDDHWHFKFAPRKHPFDPKKTQPGGECKVWKPVRISSTQRKVIQEVVDEQRQYLKDIIQEQSTK